jgi:cysteinyl-tRNA synthetase
VLGLSLDDVWQVPALGASDGSPMLAVPPDVEARLRERSAARDAREFELADAIRATLGAEGWDVIDGPEGSRVVRRSGSPSGSPSASPDATRTAR